MGLALFCSVARLPQGSLSTDVANNCHMYQYLKLLFDAQPEPSPGLPPEFICTTAGREYHTGLAMVLVRKKSDCSKSTVARDVIGHPAGFINASHMA